MSPDAIGALRHMRDRNSDQLLGLHRQSSAGKDLLAKCLKGLLRPRAKNVTPLSFENVTQFLESEAVATALPKGFFQ